jgi:hypothetical protein
MKESRFLLAFLLFSLGCASASRNAGVSSPVAGSEDFKPSSSLAKLFVRRPSGGAKTRLALSANGRPVGALMPGEFFIVAAAAGTHAFALEQAGAAGERLAEFELELNAGTRIFLSCGSKPRHMSKRELILLPKRLCAPKPDPEAECASFDALGKMCRGALYDVEGGDVCAKPWREEFDASHFKGAHCVIDRNPGGFLPHLAGAGRADRLGVESFYSSELMRRVSPETDPIVTVEFRAFEMAAKVGTIEAVERYLERYPEGSRVEDARKLIRDLEEVKELEDWKRTMAEQKCRTRADGWVYLGESCYKGFVHGEATVVDRDRRRQIRGVFDFGELKKGQLIDKSGGLLYDGEWTLARIGSGKRAAFHGQGRLFEKAGETERLLLFEGSFYNGKPHGDGICLMDNADRYEPCEYRYGRRVDDLHRLREERDKLKAWDSGCRNDHRTLVEGVKTLEENLVLGCLKEFEKAEKALFWVLQVPETMYYHRPEGRWIEESIEEVRFCVGEKKLAFEAASKAMEAAAERIKTNHCPATPEADPHDAYRAALKIEIGGRLNDYRKIEDAYLSYEADKRAYGKMRREADRKSTGGLVRLRGIRETVERVSADISPVTRLTSLILHERYRRRKRQSFDRLREKFDKDMAWAGRIETAHDMEKIKILQETVETIASWEEQLDSRLGKFRARCLAAERRWDKKLGVCDYSDALKAAVWTPLASAGAPAPSAH